MDGATSVSRDTRRRSEWFAVALPSLLLISVAIVQVVLVRTVGLSPWKGGGFGMFASIDGLSFREVRIQVDAPERSERLAVPPSLQRFADAAATLPSRASLQRLADQVIARERRLGRAVNTVRIEVWRASYDRTLESSWTLLSDLSVTPRADPAASDNQPH